MRRATAVGRIPRAGTGQSAPGKLHWVNTGTEENPPGNLPPCPAEAKRAPQDRSDTSTPAPDDARRPAHPAPVAKTHRPVAASAPLPRARAFATSAGNHHIFLALGAPCPPRLRTMTALTPAVKTHRQPPPRAGHFTCQIASGPDEPATALTRTPITGPHESGLQKP